MGVDRGSWPGWVWVGLCGLSTRGSAWAFVWISLAFGARSVAFGFIGPRSFRGGGPVFVVRVVFLGHHVGDPARQRGLRRPPTRRCVGNDIKKGSDRPPSGR